MPRPQLIAVALAAMLFAPAAAAIQYSIEIIVFARPAADAGEERWNFASPRIQQRIAQMQTLAQRASKHETSDSLRALQPVRRELASAGYRILAATRWRQPTSSFQKAPLIALGAPGGELPAGFVRVYSPDLIYADLQLHFSPAGVAGEDRPQYFISEKRRLKFKQVHYFDHPLYGAILGVWKEG